MEIVVFLVVVILVICWFVLGKDDCDIIPDLPKPRLVRSDKVVKYNIRLSIKAIIRAEMIMSKPFTEIDYTDIDDLMKLLYCTVLANNSILFTFEEFKVIAGNEKQLVAMLKEIEKANLVMGQFTKPSGNDAEGGSGESQYTKDLIGMLIMAGVDANFAMNEMEISDIPVFLEAYEKKRREEMEASRLWTFLNVAPHIDTKKIKSAKDLMLFPWEEEETRKLAEEALTRDREMAEHFFKEGMNMFRQPSNE